jgi:hypothetical protein
MAEKSLTLPQFIKGGRGMAKAKKADDDELDDDDLKKAKKVDEDLDDDDSAAKKADDDDASADEDASKAKRAKRAKKADDGDADMDDDDASAKKAAMGGDGLDEDDLFDDDSMDQYEDTSKQDSQPHLKPKKAGSQASGGAAKEAAATRALAESALRENRQLKEQVRDLRLKERQREIKDQVRKLAEPATVGKARVTFAKPVIDEFKKIALSNAQAGDRAFALLAMVKQDGMVDLSERGRDGDPEDEANDPYRSERTLTDKKTGLPMVGVELEKRAIRYASEHKLSWDDLTDRENAFRAVLSDPKAGQSGITRTGE